MQNLITLLVIPTLFIQLDLHLPDIEMFNQIMGEQKNWEKEIS
jgi:hypothetical protein